MSTRLKPSERVALRCSILAAIVAGGVWWFFPGMHWGGALAIWCLAAAGFYRADLEMSAQARIIDRD